MARLVSYKVKDENRYSTFGGEPTYTSSENLTERNRIKMLFKKKSKPSSPQKNTIKDNKKCKASNNTITTTTGANTMPTISASVESHRNKIAQSTSKSNCLSGNITRGRHRQSSYSTSKSKFKCCTRDGWFCCFGKCKNRRQNHQARSDAYQTRRSNCCGTNGCWWKWCCCASPRHQSGCCLRKWFCGCGTNDFNNEDDDDDIDAKFEQYKNEMRLKEFTNSNCNSIDAINGGECSSVELNFHRNEASITIDANQAIDNVNDITMGNKQISKKFRYRKYWNWNDSLRSNSDKFLETLEYDMDGEQSLKRTNNKSKQKGYWSDCLVVFFSIYFFALFSRRVLRGHRCNGCFD